MRSDEYHAFSRDLAARLEREPRVIGLVALGSMAGRDYGPDEWSDHDFFVVTEPGAQEGLRRDLGWLPQRGGIVLTLRETEHGLKVLYGDGHLLEFAVFDRGELGLARVNRYRVLLDRGGVVDRLAEVAAATAAEPPPDDAWLLGQVVTLALVGAGRHRRGEVLSGAALVKGAAVRELARLVARTEDAPLLDRLDPLRRVERAAPDLGRELGALLGADTEAAALGLLDLAEQRLRSSRPDLGWAALDAVRRRLRGGDPP